MNIRRFQGWALVVVAVIRLLSLLGPGTAWARILIMIGLLLFIVGVPVIQSVQPMGATGLIGIVLLELAAVISPGVNIFFAMGGSSINNAIPLTSALAGGFGGIIVGWLTTRGRVFPAWIGWALILEGILHLIGNFDLGTLGPVLSIVGVLLLAAAYFAYGWGILQRQRV